MFVFHGKTNKKISQMDIFPERESLLTNTENSYSFGCIDERVELGTLAADLDVEQSLNRN